MTDSSTTPQPAGRRVALVLACIIGFALAGSFAFAAWMKLDEQRHIRAVGKTTDGTIVGEQEVRTTGRRGSVLSITYRPTFRFRTADGKDVEATATDKMERAEIVPGRVMRVLYDPADPSYVRIASVVEEDDGSLPWILGGVALLAAAFSIFAATRIMRRG